MIPLNDTIPSRTYPFVNYALIVFNILFFFIELGQGPELESFIHQFGVIPSSVRFVLPSGVPLTESLYRHYFPFVSSLFLHGGWLHLLGNMLFLWIFGDNVEDRMGHFRYLVFYLLCGILASVSHVLMNAESAIPTIGASGAIAGVMGAYILLYPRARVRTLIIIFIFIDIIEIPAFIFIIFWMVLQIFNGLGSIAAEQSSGGVAWFAHIGGFATGFVLVNLFRKSDKKKKKPRINRLESRNYYHLSN